MAGAIFPAPGVKNLMSDAGPQAPYAKSLTRHAPTRATHFPSGRRSEARAKTKAELKPFCTGKLQKAESILSGLCRLDAILH